eukprot:GSA25T00000204001.1
MQDTGIVGTVGGITATEGQQMRSLKRVSDDSTEAAAFIFARKQARRGNRESTTGKADHEPHEVFPSTSKQGFPASSPPPCGNLKPTKSRKMAHIMRDLRSHIMVEEIDNPDDAEFALGGSAGTSSSCRSKTNYGYNGRVGDLVRSPRATEGTLANYIMENQPEDEYGYVDFQDEDDAPPPALVDDPGTGDEGEGAPGTSTVFNISAKLMQQQLDLFLQEDDEFLGPAIPSAITDQASNEEQEFQFPGTEDAGVVDQHFPISTEALGAGAFSSSGVTSTIFEPSTSTQHLHRVATSAVSSAAAPNEDIFNQAPEQ